MFSITQNGKELDKSKYTWDEKTQTLSTEENNLVLDFGDYSKCTFNTGYGCTFKTGSGCTFKTSYGCTFKTGSGCTFKTSYGCVAIRYDVKGITEIPENKTIKFKSDGIIGYDIIEEKKEVSCNGKVVEIDGKKYKLQEIV